MMSKQDEREMAEDLKKNFAYVMYGAAGSTKTCLAKTTSGAKQEIVKVVLSSPLRVWWMPVQQLPARNH